MGIRKKQFIDTIDMWTLADKLNVHDHRKELEVYALVELDDMMINSIATDILAYRTDLEVTDANIASIMNTIMEYVTVEYRAF